MNAKECFQTGQLTEAIAAAADEVRGHPTDLARRNFLCQLLCFAGDLSRADTHLEAMSKQDPQAMLPVSMFRQLIRAETSRQEFYDHGRLPELLEKPTEHLQLHLQASICVREGKPDEAAQLLAEAEQRRPHPAGVVDGEPFDDFRDLDDLTASFFEVLSPTGKYFWIPAERVELIELRKPEQPRDLLWRRAHMVVCGGPDGEVFLPALYPGSHAEEDPRLRLGRLTDWRGGEHAPMRGVGLRMFLFGEQDRSILEIGEIRFTNPVSE